MKTSTIVLSLILSVAAMNIVSAQDSTRFNNQKNEINIGFFNVFQLSSIPSFGVGYKRRIGNGAFRVRANFSTQNSEDETDSVRASSTSSVYIQPQIGYEFQKDFGRLLLYYGVDLSTSYRQSENMHENLLGLPNKVTNKSESFNFGVNPFIGLKVFINSTISVSTETFFFVTYSIYESVYTSSQETRTTSGNAFRTGLSPLGVFSINFHF